MVDRKVVDPRFGHWGEQDGRSDPFSGTERIDLELEGTVTTGIREVTAPGLKMRVGRTDDGRIRTWDGRSIDLSQLDRGVHVRRTESEVNSPKLTGLAYWMDEFSKQPLVYGGAVIGVGIVIYALFLR